MTTLPLDFAPLREGAEEMAREFDATSNDGRDLGPGAPWVVLVFMRLLSDLTRPASLAFWREWLGARLGLDTSGGIVLTWTPTAGKKNCRDYLLSDLNGHDYCIATVSAKTTPAEALRLAILAATGMTP